MTDAEARLKFRMGIVQSIDAMELAGSGNLESSSYLREGGGTISGTAEAARRAHGGSGKHVGRSCCGRPRSYPKDGQVCSRRHRGVSERQTVEGRSLVVRRRVS